MAENKDIPQFVACGLEMGNCGYQIPYDMAEHERIIRADAIDEFAKSFVEEGKKIKYLRHLWIESTCKKIAEQLKEQNK